MGGGGDKIVRGPSRNQTKKRETSKRGEQCNMSGGLKSSGETEAKKGKRPKARKKKKKRVVGHGVRKRPES